MFINDFAFKNAVFLGTAPLACLRARNDDILQWFSKFLLTRHHGPASVQGLRCFCRSH